MNNSIYPISFDFENVKQKGLVENNKLSKKYFELQNNYKIIFEEYINSVLNLKKYDDLITNNDLKFGMCPVERKDYYQKTSTLNLNYMYIKNNLHIEKLSVEDLKMLEENNKELVIELVKRTYKDIIRIDYLNGKKMPDKFKTQFFEGFDTNQTIFDNDSLIIIIKEGPANNGLEGDEFQENLKKKYEFITNLIETMNKEFKDKLLCDIEICHLLR